MDYFLDCEFIEDGPSKPLKLISIGIVAEDGRELYYENSDVSIDEFSPWLKANVAPYLSGPKLPHNQIGSKILNFFAADKKPVIWGWYADYDWVLFCQLFGRMIDLPDILPMFCMDLKQMAVMLGVGKPPVPMGGNLHNALDDARWNKAVYSYLLKVGCGPNRLIKGE